jgi:hypothetical protein
MAANPEFPPLQSISLQLEYLIGIIKGEITDLSRLKDVIVGQYAAREFEDRDMGFANQLYEVSDIADELKRKC